MLPFYPRVGDGVAKATKKRGLSSPPPIPRSNKTKRKKGSWPLLKVGDGTHQNQNKKENRVLTFKLMLPNSPLLKLQALHSLSSKLPKPKRSTY